jgi:hypothetical protein
MRLKENFRRKRPVKWRNNSWALHRDNAPADTSLLVRQLLTSTKTTVTPTVLTPLLLCGLFFFPNMDLKLKGEEIQAELQDVMKMLTQNDFQQCFRSCKSRWDSCINAEEGYFEGQGRE